MPPPDNTPPVLTPGHVEVLEWALLHHWTANARNHLTEIQSVVRTIVESGGTLRLAGEDEVIVKWAALEFVQGMATDAAKISAREGRRKQQGWFEDIAKRVNRWLAVSPTAQNPGVSEKSE